VNLFDIVQRAPVPQPWAEGDKIPWNDPAFSARMLREHLSQAHDAASRRFAVIDRQVAWIQAELLAGQPTRILDLGCGPGLYSSRLARLGHTCVGLDFGPASVAYAREQAEREHLACTYRLEDIRQADYGIAAYGLVMLLYGEFNVFRPTDARAILSKAHAALVQGGLLLLEPHTFDTVRSLAHGTSWYSSPGGLFSDRPHLCLEESAWDEAQHVTIQRYYVVDAETGAVQRHAASNQAYTDEEYTRLIQECSFTAPHFYPSLEGSATATQPGLMVLVARKNQKG